MSLVDWFTDNLLPGSSACRTSLGGRFLAAAIVVLIKVTEALVAGGAHGLTSVSWEPPKRT